MEKQFQLAHKTGIYWVLTFQLFSESATSIGIVSGLKMIWICLPAEPIGLVMQSQVLYYGLNLSFAATILLAKQSLELSKYRINKSNCSSC